jgi:plasmid replication initiation protein
MIGLESVRRSAGKLSNWANFRQPALDVPIAEINRTSDLHIKLNLWRLSHRIDALKFAIKTQTLPKDAKSNS